MPLIVEFSCGFCGFRSGGIVEIPDGADARTPVNLLHDCGHCGAPLTRSFDALADLLDEAAAGAPFYDDEETA